jgi:ABC-2 type transport system ATP-binding protein
MRQKLAIARALLHEPKVLFLDEPTSALDPEAARLVRSFIAELGSQGRTIFMCTHNLEEADHLCDRIGIFRSHLIEIDTPEALRRKYFGRQVVFHLRTAEQSWLAGIKALEGVQAVQLIDQKLVVDLQDPEKLNPQIIRILVKAGADIQFVGELRHSLEDIYLQTIRDAGTEAVSV